MVLDWFATTYVDCKKSNPHDRMHGTRLVYNSLGEMCTLLACLIENYIFGILFDTYI